MRRRVWSGLALGSAALLAVVMFWPHEPEPTSLRSASQRPPLPAAVGPTGQPPATAPEETASELQASGLARQNEAPPAPESSVESEEALRQSRTPVRLYADARVRPIYDLATNQVQGVQILEVKPGSFWQRIGVESHDVILELNGQLIDSPNATVALMNDISSGHILSLRVRNVEGRERFIDYRTPD